MKKKLLAAALAVCMVFGSAAALPQGTFDGGIGITASAKTGDGSDLSTQTLEDGTLEITRYDGDGGTVIIPSENRKTPLRSFFRISGRSPSQTTV